MVIAVTGGGSGGHITPVLAVAKELKSIDPDITVVYIGQKGDGLSDIPRADPNIDAVYTVQAGKFRRYHGEGARQLLDLRTQYLNVRDVLRVAVGVVQSFWIMRKVKPSALFTRGGFVSVPVAIGAKLNRIPYLTHDSDSIPSLANRIIARWAALHAVAMPPEAYPYPLAKTKMVGVPISHNFELMTPGLQSKYRKELQLDSFEHVLLITGGGNGAQILNELVVRNAAYLCERFPNLAIVHIAGRSLENDTRSSYEAVLPVKDMERVRILGFVTDLYVYSGAADVVVARGGATNLAEFAVQGKACIIVPSKQLVWNMKNAQVMHEREAIRQLTEEEASKGQHFGEAIGDLLDNALERQELGRRLAEFAHPNSAQELAALILKVANK